VTLVVASSGPLSNNGGVAYHTHSHTHTHIGMNEHTHTIYICMYFEKPFRKHKVTR